MGRGSIKDELLELERESWRRTRTRLEGLTDEELLWSPVQPCWTVRPLADGTWVTDWAMPAPPTPPFTTLAWRLVHLIGCYGSARNSQWLGVHVDAEPIEDGVTPAPHTAAETLALLDRAHSRWLEILDRVDDESLATPIGPIGGQYAEASRAGFVVHMLDEVIHHAAEAAVLRDLHRAQRQPLHPDPAVVGLMVGEDSWDAVTEPGALTSILAELGRLDLVEAAIARGFPTDGPTPTALHRAAALGRTGVVDALLAAGADRTLRDPRFGATPAEWATFFGQPELAARLKG